jgi:signal transduction histidine kinase
MKLVNDYGMANSNDHKRRYLMRDELIAPLETIVDASRTLLSDTMLTVMQEKMLQSIHTVSFDMFDLIVSIPDLTWDRAAEIFSFETRSNLASIIGYAEMLLEEEEGPLDESQHELMDAIHASATQLVDRLTRMLG